MGRTWHDGSAVTMAPVPVAAQEVQVWHDGFWCWSFRLWVMDGTTRVSWGAGIAGTGWGARRLARRCSRLAALPPASRNMRCTLVARLGRCDGLTCYPWWMGLASERANRRITDRSQPVPP